MFELFDPKAEFCIREGNSLPHWYQVGVSYFVTFRTVDSIPVDVSRRWHAQRDNWLQQNGISPNDPNWRDRLAELSETTRRQFHKTFSRRYLETLDKGLGACVLRRRELRDIVGKSLQHFHGDRYNMGDFVVMPNHVHLIVCLLGDTEIESLCASWKRFTARQINEKLGKTGRFWQEESFDHLIRSPEQFEAIQRYICNNPINLPQNDYLLYKVAGTLRVP